MKDYLPLNRAKLGTVPGPKDAVVGHPRRRIWQKYLSFEESHSITQLLTVGKFTKTRTYCCVIRFLIHEYTTPGTRATWKLFCNHKNNI